MKNIALLMVFVFSITQLTAQTKRIAHRSHSGTNATLALLEDDNLGAPYNFEKGWWKDGKMIEDSFAKLKTDTLYLLDIKDSIYKKPSKDSLVKSKINTPQKNLKDTAALIKKDAPTIKVTPVEQKKQGFPLYLFLLIAIPMVITAFITKKHIK